MRLRGKTRSLGIAGAVTAFPCGRPHPPFVAGILVRHAWLGPAGQFLAVCKKSDTMLWLIANRTAGNRAGGQTRIVSILRGREVAGGLTRVLMSSA